MCQHVLNGSGWSEPGYLAVLGLGRGRWYTQVHTLALTPSHIVYQTDALLGIPQGHTLTVEVVSWPWRFPQGHTLTVEVVSWPPRALTVEVGFIQDLWLDDLFYDVLQGDNAQHLIERVPFAFIVHSLDNGQVRLSWRTNDIIVKIWIIFRDFCLWEKQYKDIVWPISGLNLPQNHLKIGNFVIFLLQRKAWYLEEIELCIAQW